MYLVTKSIMILLLINHIILCNHHHKINPRNIKLKNNNISNENEDTAQIVSLFHERENTWMKYK